MLRMSSNVKGRKCPNYPNCRDRQASSITDTMVRRGVTGQLGQPVVIREVGEVLIGEMPFVANRRVGEFTFDHWHESGLMM